MADAAAFGARSAWVRSNPAMRLPYAQVEAAIHYQCVDQSPPLLFVRLRNVPTVPRDEDVFPDGGHQAQLRFDDSPSTFVPITVRNQTGDGRDVILPSSLIADVRAGREVRIRLMVEGRPLFRWSLGGATASIDSARARAECLESPRQNDSWWTERAEDPMEDTVYFSARSAWVPAKPVPRPPYADIEGAVGYRCGPLPPAWNWELQPSLSIHLRNVPDRTGDDELLTDGRHEAQVRFDDRPSTVVPVFIEPRGIGRVRVVLPPRLVADIIESREMRVRLYLAGDNLVFRWGLIGAAASIDNAQAECPEDPQRWNTVQDSPRDVQYSVAWLASSNIVGQYPLDTCLLSNACSSLRYKCETVATERMFVTLHRNRHTDALSFRRRFVETPPSEINARFDDGFEMELRITDRLIDPTEDAVTLYFRLPDLLPVVRDREEIYLSLIWPTNRLNFRWSLSGAIAAIESARSKCQDLE